MKSLLIDDLRVLDVTYTARTYEEGVKALSCESWDILYLDHDLACYDEKGREYTGKDIMNFLIQNPDLAPKGIMCISANPIGRKEINYMIRDLYNTIKLV